MKRLGFVLCASLLTFGCGGMVDDFVDLDVGLPDAEGEVSLDGAPFDAGDEAISSDAGEVDAIVVDDATIEDATVEDVSPEDTGAVLDTGVVASDTGTVVVDAITTDAIAIDTGVIGIDAIVADVPLLDGSTLDTSVIDSAPSDVGIDADSAADATSDASHAITCGTTTCDDTTQECCVPVGPTGGTATCKTKGTCTGAIALSCSSGASCPSGQTCCLTLSFGGSSSSCAATCGGGGGGPGGGGSVPLCSVDSDCPAGRKCRNTPLGVKACLP